MLDVVNVECWEEIERLLQEIATHKTVVVSMQAEINFLLSENAGVKQQRDMYINNITELILEIKELRSDKEQTAKTCLRILDAEDWRNGCCYNSLARCCKAIKEKFGLEI